MPSHRSRSHSRSRSPQGHRLPSGVSEISADDYFLKSAEFRVWLKDEKKKYFDELSGDKARSYFRKFVKAWNRGKLSSSLYAGIDPSAQPATSQTAYKWSFATKNSRADEESLRAARASISQANYHPSASASTSTSGPRTLGPTLPTAADLTLAREMESEYKSTERGHKRKREKAEDKERVEDLVGPKEVGREGMLEKKRAKREGDRSFRERGDDGFLEADEGTLMGGGDSFKDRIAKRDAGRKRFEESRVSGRELKLAEHRERATALREKDKATMDMFQQLAKQRFG